MARANQGIRQDLNFQEIEQEIVALSNLSEVGLANDLKVIQNNLRNSSLLAFNSVNVNTDEFDFTTDKILTVTGGFSEIETNLNQTIKLTISVNPTYETYPGEVIVVSGFTGTGSTIFNGEYQTISVGAGGTNISYRRSGNTFTGTGTVDGSTQAAIKSGTSFVYTNGDIVNVSTDVSVGSTTLKAGTDYFVCDSNTRDKFKLSFTSRDSASGINTVDITSSPAQFNFIRKEPVFKGNIETFQQPEIQDEQEFGAYLAGSINNIMGIAQENGENATYFVTKKYKGTEDTIVDTEIKFEGTVNLFDPIGFNANSGDLTNAKSPGIFIGNTRAFSADNNPWSPDAVEGLVTDSVEVSISELEFGRGSATTANYDHGMNIQGIQQVDTGSPAPFSFTHKIPITVDGETYYLLMKQA